LSHSYEADADSYFRGFERRLEMVLSNTSGHSIDKPIEAFSAGLQGTVKRVLKIPPEEQSYHPLALQRDRKLLDRLKTLFDDTVLDPDRHGGITIELHVQLEREIALLEEEIDANSKKYGNKRSAKNSTYKMAGEHVCDVLSRHGFPYAAAEAAVFVWFCGACDLVDERDVIDPFSATAAQPGKDTRDPLQSTALKRFCSRRTR